LDCVNLCGGFDEEFCNIAALNNLHSHPKNTRQTTLRKQEYLSIFWVYGKMEALFKVGCKRCFKQKPDNHTALGRQNRRLLFNNLR
jgi:hypothetical protein